MESSEAQLRFDETGDLMGIQICVEGVPLANLQCATPAEVDALRLESRRR